MRAPRWMAVMLAVAIGGATGALLREALLAALSPWPPWTALLCINLPGSLLIGVCLVHLELRYHKTGRSILRGLPGTGHLLHQRGLFAPDPTVLPTEYASITHRGHIAAGFVITGLLGGFTTFSTFSLDLVELLQRGDILSAMVNVAISVIPAVAGVVAGMALRLLLCRARAVQGQGPN